MPKLDVFSISLDGHQCVYYCGQTISGHVNVTLNQPMKMRGIRLRFDGKANVHWTEQHSSGSGKNRHTTTRHYSADETYFDYVLVLYGKAPDQGGDNPTHPAGTFTYHFQYQIPQGCPSSFEGSVGRVRYKLTAVIDKPWKIDRKYVVAYTLLNPLDLNRDEASMTTPTNSATKTLCCLCCASGPIDVMVRLNRGGFVPGESILINAEIENHSNRDMDSTYAELHQTTLYHARTKTRTETRNLGKVHEGPISPGAMYNWTNVALAIPAVPPSRLDGCQIIDISYMVKFVVDPSGPAVSLKVPLPIVIGSIPLLSVMGLPDNTPPFMAPPGVAPSASPMIDDRGYTGMPPPSYAECMFGRVNIKDEGEEETTRGDNFAPVYTYYDWNRPPKLS